ncbi:hypothetical protein CI238_12642 [Colletotrichum incanum]|uniref:Uncharacterized protein n=1 Tax=Colletotrichum incanum TaxID=1573173 RepID=A0A167D2B6_COLIC|nr:hypothetical protein CI238_12642 [Colletotrichum incanum]
MHTPLNSTGARLDLVATFFLRLPQGFIHSLCATLNSREGEESRGIQLVLRKLETKLPAHRAVNESALLTSHAVWNIVTATLLSAPVLE